MITLKNNRQRGFTLIELILAIGIATVLSLIATTQIVKASEEKLAESSGEYIRIVSAAAERHVLLNFDAYANGTPLANPTVPAIPLMPTIAELVTLGRLNTGFPSGANSLPTKQSLQINVIKQSCPGVNCKLIALVCTTTPINLGRAATRFDLAQTMVEKQGGAGGQSRIGDGANIRGPAFALANPMGNVEGIVCGNSSVDTAMYQQYVRFQDTRDPDLKGTLTVAGATTINDNATVNGSLSAASATIAGNLTAGSLNAGTAAISSTGAVTATTLKTSGAVTASVFTPTGTAKAGDTCTAAEDGSIAKNRLSVGLMVCQSGSWRALTTTAAVGDVCTAGSMATSAAGISLLCVGGKYLGMDTIVRTGLPGDPCLSSGMTAINVANNNEMLICRLSPLDSSLKYMRLHDLVQNLSFVQSIEVTDSSVPVSSGGNGIITKPVCTPATATMTATPIIQLIPKAVGSKDGGIAFFVTDVVGDPTKWKVSMLMGDGTTPLQGAPNAVAVAHLYCYFD